MKEGKENVEDSSAPLIEHLTELRQRLIYSVAAFTVAMLACFTIWKPIFNFLTLPLCKSMSQRGHQDCGLILIKLQEGFLGEPLKFDEEVTHQLAQVFLNFALLWDTKLKH